EELQGGVRGEGRVAVDNRLDEDMGEHHLRAQGARDPLGERPGFLGAVGEVGRYDDSMEQIRSHARSPSRRPANPSGPPSWSHITGRSSHRKRSATAGSRGTRTNSSDWGAELSAGGGC